MERSGSENKTTTRVPMNQIRNEQTTAFLLDFQAKYVNLKAIAKYMFAIKASIDARLRIIKSRLKKQVTIAKDCPLNQLTSKIVYNM